MLEARVGREKAGRWLVDVMGGEKAGRRLVDAMAAGIRGVEDLEGWAREPLIEGVVLRAGRLVELLERDGLLDGVPESVGFLVGPVWDVGGGAIGRTNDAPELIETTKLS